MYIYIYIYIYINFGCNKQMSIKIYIHNKMTSFSKLSMF